MRTGAGLAGAGFAKRGATLPEEWEVVFASCARGGDANNGAILVGASVGEGSGGGGGQLLSRCLLMRVLGTWRWQIGQQTAVHFRCELSQVQRRIKPEYHLFLPWRMNEEGELG